MEHGKITGGRGEADGGKLSPTKPRTGSKRFDGEATRTPLNSVVFQIVG